VQRAAQVRNSDRKVHHGHITKQGSPWVRGILQEAAQTAKRHPMFASAYDELAWRRGKNNATTAIARRLLARSFHRSSAACGHLTLLDLL
jgi:transposase